MFPFEKKNIWIAWEWEKKCIVNMKYNLYNLSIENVEK